jgi:Holliday junction DNA helicase RuvA
MFAFLRGTIARKGVGLLELDVNGVGYEVHVSDQTQRRVQLEAPATFLTYCHIREDSFHIFGFLREEERALFKMLLGVQGIGPKVAMAVQSAMSVSEFARALRENDLTAFTKISGVGKKTGQRILLEMKAKLGQDTDLTAILGEPESAGAENSGDDVIEALMSLGCTQVEAKRAAAGARKKLGDVATAEELVKAALRSMARV